VALAPLSADTEGPLGNGYLALTVAAGGSVVYSGLLADGTAVSGSAVGSHVSWYEGTGTPALLIPIFTAKQKVMLGGMLVLAPDPQLENRVVVLPEIVPAASGQTRVSVPPLTHNRLRWVNANPLVSESGDEGYVVDVQGCGGYYDKLVNLQAYYLGFDFVTTSLADSQSSFPETMSAILTTLAYVPEGAMLDLAGDVFSADKRVLVKQAGSKTLNDFAASINPENLTIQFVRATGLYTGKVAVWYEGSNAQEVMLQGELSFTYKGIMTLQKAVESNYGDNPGMGCLLIPKSATSGALKRSWTTSVPFDLILRERQSDWTDEGWSTLSTEAK
jgi:hypothetical protein